MGMYPNFYNSINGDRVYNAESFEEFIKPFFTTGVFNGGLQVTASTIPDMQINVSSGYVNINGKVKYYETNSVFTIEAANSTLKRIDNVVIRRDDVQRDFIMFVQKGAFSNDPEAPTPTRSNGIYDLVIAQIYVDAAAVYIRQENILDTRTDTNLCGWVASTVEEIPFNQITAQWESFINTFKATNETAFTAWFNTIKNQLGADVAGNLQNQITQINSKDSQQDTAITALQADSTVTANESRLGKIKVGTDLSIEVDGTLRVKATTTQNKTLLASSWTGANAPFQYELSVTGVTASSNQDILPSPSITAEQFDFASGAKIIEHHQETNKIVLWAIGDKPTVDIPIKVILRGEK